MTEANWGGDFRLLKHVLKTARVGVESRQDPYFARRSTLESVGYRGFSGSDDGVDRDGCNA